MMKTIVMLEAIEAYPNGQREFYAAGATLSFDDDYADLLIAKGHAKALPSPRKDQKTEESDQ